MRWSKINNGIISFAIQFYIFQNVRARAVIFSARLSGNHSIINEDIKSIDNLIGEIAERWMFYCDISACLQSVLSHN